MRIMATSDLHGSRAASWTRSMAHQRPEEMDKQAVPRMDVVLSRHPFRRHSRQS